MGGRVIGHRLFMLGRVFKSAKHAAPLEPRMAASRSPIRASYRRRYIPVAIRSRDEVIFAPSSDCIDARQGAFSRH